MKPKLIIYIKNYKLHSIYIKYISLLLLLLVIPLTISSLTSAYGYHKIINTEVIYSNNDMLKQLSNTTDSVINNIITQMRWFAYDINTLNFLKSNDENYFTSHNMKNLKTLIPMLQANTQCIYSVYCYSDKSKKIVSNQTCENISTFFDNSWYYEYIDDIKQNDITIKPRFITDTGIQNACISIFQNIVIDDIFAGVVVVNISSHRLKLLLSSSLDERFAFFDQSGNLLFNTSNVNTNFLQAHEVPGVIIDKNKNVISYLKTDKLNWTYVLSSPLNSKISKADAYKRLIVFANYFSVILSVLFALYISYRLFIPVADIMETAEKAYDNSSVNLGKNFDNEISYIVNAISKNISDKNNYQKELQLRLELLKKSQISALQYQINPHFLYNTLTTIRFLAMNLTNSENKVSSAVSTLASLFKISLDNSQFTVVSKEIEYIKLYIDLQKMRYNDKFEVVYDLDPDTMTLKTVKMILQPIVENAIYHGIKSLNEKGLIKIKNGITNGNLEFIISDNGQGMSEEAIKAVNLDDTVLEDSTHIGLKNVNQRLKILFGDEYKLSVQSQPNKGTSVTIRMPLRL